MLKAVIFDVDGVLVDSREANVVRVQRLLANAGYPQPSRQAIEACFHLPLLGTLQKLMSDASPDEVRRVWEIAHDQSTIPVELYSFPDKLHEVLAVLHARYKLAVVTSRLPTGMSAFFNRVEIEHLFDVVVTFGDYENPKPHPEPLQVALKKLHVRPAEAVYIGDSDTDIEAAQAADMKSIHLAAKPHQGADAAVGEFHELIDAVEALAAS